jgi:alpha-tubulin suppressor-like RCC1 family protein
MAGVISLAGASAWGNAAARENGTVWIWGIVLWDATGKPMAGALSAPTQLLDIDGVIEVAGGWEHAMYLRNDGTVWGRGNAKAVGAGDGGGTIAQTPMISNVSAIRAGTLHSVALRADGTVWAWGDNLYYELGFAGPASVPVPIQVPGIDEVTAIAVGEVHTLALRADGSVWTWGMLGAEALAGTGDDPYVPGPVRVHLP